MFKFEFLLRKIKKGDFRFLSLLLKNNVKIYFIDLLINQVEFFMINRWTVTRE